MYHLKLPLLLLLLLVLLQYATTAPNNRFSISSSEQVDEMLDGIRLTAPGLQINPFLQFAGLQSERELNTVNSPQHHIEKRRCNTATCMTQRLADFLIRSSNTIGTVYLPTNIGANTYGKRGIVQSPNLLPL